MPIRVRKSVKVAPGVRMNFSNGGVSTSAGTGGFRLTSPKGGCLSILAWPVVAVVWIYYWIFKLLWMAVVSLWRVATATPQSKRVTAVSVGALAVIGLISSAVNAITGDTEPPAPTVDMASVQQTALANAWLPFTQTAAALPTSTFTLEPLPTATLELPTLVPTLQPPTPTLLIYNSPTIGPAAAVCPCSGDTLNCSDFAGHNSAQACYNYCVSIGVGDIHNLDRDGNGLACESN